jgi:phospholipid transport system substrate-binding protein
VQPTIRSTSPTTRRSNRLGILAAAVTLGASLALAAAGPRDVVKALADQVLVVLKDKSLSSDTKRHKIETLVYGSVDFDTLSKLVLARNLSRFSPDEIGRFQQEFKRHLSVTYGKSVDSYKNETVSIVGDREEARGDWTVRTKIDRGGVDDIAVDYRMRQANGEWKIIDFIVEGVSLVSNFRSQFQDILSAKTPGELIELIHEKNARGEAFDKTNT